MCHDYACSESWLCLFSVCCSSLYAHHNLLFNFQIFYHMCFIIHISLLYLSFSCVNFRYFVCVEVSYQMYLKIYYKEISLVVNTSQFSYMLSKLFYRLYRFSTIHQMFSQMFSQISKTFFSITFSKTVFSK